MEALPKTIEFFGLSFSVPILLSCLVTVLVVTIFSIVAARNVSMKPGKMQNVFESLMDFTKGIVNGAVDEETGKSYYLYVFSLFSFILIANMVGLVIYFHYGEHSYFASPTASPVVCLALSLMTTLIAHYSGVQKMGFKGYIKNSYLSPMSLMLPIKLIEEFTNTITLAFRLYGNIYAGEVLLGLIVMFSSSFGILTYIFAIPLGVVWQGFSVVIGAIQAYVFCTLTMVYIAHKVEHE